MHVNLPLSVNGRGRTATTDHDEHVSDLIEQVLFTAQGERVNRPDFGSGVERLVFAPNSDELAAATKTLVQSALQRWLADDVVVENVETSNVDGRLEVTVVYQDRQTGERVAASFTRET